MRRTAQTDMDDAPGHDSFLDIVTNVVGILIILVMVVGVQAKDAWIEAADPIATESTEEEIDVDTPRLASESVEVDIHGLLQKTKEVKAAAMEQFQRREQLQLLATAAKRDLEERRARLDDADRRQFDLSRQLADARGELEQLQREREAAEQLQARVEVIDHLPTPMAKTVFGREEHFRLQRGRLTYVPLNDLFERFKSEGKAKIWRLEEASEVTETLGPVGGFRMKYTIERKQVRMDTPSGPMLREMASLARFILVPVSDSLGDPVAAALQPNSRFHRLIESFDPRSTTITIWCYPDTFDSFRAVKAVLFERGFRTAGRPLPAGYPIGGAPDGSRSVSE